LAVVLFLAWYMNRSVWGYELRIAGSSARTATYVGISMRSKIVGVMPLSGALVITEAAAIGLVVATIQFATLVHLAALGETIFRAGRGAQPRSRGDDGHRCHGRIRGSGRHRQPVDRVPGRRPRGRTPRSAPRGHLGGARGRPGGERAGSHHPRPGSGRLPRSRLHRRCSTGPVHQHPHSRCLRDSVGL